MILKCLKKPQYTILVLALEKCIYYLVKYSKYKNNCDYELLWGLLSYNIIN